VHFRALYDRIDLIFSVISEKFRSMTEKKHRFQKIDFRVVKKLDFRVEKKLDFRVVKKLDFSAECKYKWKGFSQITTRLLQ